MPSPGQLQNVGSDGGLECLQASLNCKDYRLATGRGKGSSARCTQRNRRLEKQIPFPTSLTWSELRRGSQKWFTPQQPPEKKSSEAVREAVGGGGREKNRFLLQNFCLKSQSTPCSFLTLSCQRRAAAAEQVRGGGCSREGGGKMWKSRNLKKKKKKKHTKPPNTSFLPLC